MTEQKYRLVTRADFDGVVAGGLLIERDMINDDIIFAEPRDVQQGKIDITSNDVTTNLPYVKDVHLCFDHHLSETVRVESEKNHIIDPNAPSAARVVYDYFGGALGFPKISTEMMDAVDKADSAQFSESEILAPEGWTILNFILDPRTGLSRIESFDVPHEQLMRDMMVYCRHHPVEEILQIPDVNQRLLVFQEHEEFAERQLRRCGSIDGNIVVADMRGEDSIFACNRFLLYGLFPAAQVSIHIFPGDDTTKTLFAVGKSILNKSSAANIGLLMLEHGGGGHEAVGTCQVSNEDVDDVLMHLIERINADN
jgi:hypothetical protein